MNILRKQQQKEQIQDSSIQNGKTLDSLLELVHTDDTMSLSCDSSLDGRKKERMRAYSMP